MLFDVGQKNVSIYKHLRSKFNSLFLDARTCSETWPTKDDLGNNPCVAPDNKSDKLRSTTVIPQTESTTVLIETT